MKKLSIIIPVYNNEKYLCCCLDSIICSKKDFEIILIDDGSTDSSGMICDQYATKDTRIKVIHKKNNGVSDARNDGIKKSSAEYLMFVDSDDFLNKEWDCILDYLNDDDIYYFDKRISENSSKEELIKNVIGNNENEICIAGPFRKIFNIKLINSKNILFNNMLINGEDMLFNLECLLLATKIKIIPIDFYCYRLMIGQSTKKFNEKIIESDKMFHFLLESILSKYEISNDLKEEIINYCKINAIFTIFNRLSYIRKFKDTIPYYYFINDNIYKSALNCNNINLKKYEQIIFKLIKEKKYKMIYCFLKFKNYFLLYIKRIIKKDILTK